MPDEPDHLFTHRSREAVDLRAAWERSSDLWVAWAREPGHDSYWLFHRDAFLELLPPPGRRTLDVGCGEGRLSRDLRVAGHTVVGVDGSPRLVAAAHQAEPSIPVCVADAAALPLEDSSFDVVVAFLSLQDVNDLRGAIAEAARVLEPRGTLLIATVHPLNSAGEFQGNERESPFVITDSYLEPSFYEDDVARDGLRMVFASVHRPLQDFTDALIGSGFLIDGVREVAEPFRDGGSEGQKRWERIPMFLHLRAVRSSR